MKLFKLFFLWLIAGPLLAQGSYITLKDGAKLYVEEAGEGQPMIFITGWTMTHRFFEYQLNHFSEDYHVLTYDPRGQGRSDKTTYKNTYKDHADDLHQLIIQKNLKDVVLVGWSSGCLAIYEYFRSFGFDHVDKVVLIDEPPKWIGDVATEWVYGSFDNYRSSLKGLIEGPDDPNGIIDWMLNEPLDSTDRIWMRNDILMTPAHVKTSLYLDGVVSDYQLDLIRMAQKVPTLAMVRFDWFDEAKSWLDLYAPGIKLNRISSHAMFWERPDYFNSLLTQFLESPASIESGPAVPKHGELLIPRYGPTAVTDGRSVYVYGGAPNGGRNGDDFMHHGLTASIEKVNRFTLKSEYLGSGLYRRANHASVLVDNRLVTCGGRAQIGLSRPRVNICEYLDLETGIHREMPALPKALRTLGMVEVGGDLYVVGGLTEDSGFTNSTYRLKAGAEQWESLPNAPYSVSGKIIALDKDIYVIGGYNGEAMRSVMVFDTQTMQWRSKSDLPYPLSAFSAVTDGKSIFLFGDYVKMDAVHRYDPEEGKLYFLEEKITPRRHTAAVLVRDKVLIIGGNQTSAGAALRTIESFELRALSQGEEALASDEE